KPVNHLASRTSATNLWCYAIFGVEIRMFSTMDRRILSRRTDRSASFNAMNVKKRLLDGARMNRAIRRMAIEIVEKNRGTRDLIIVGIRSRGVPIGERIAKEIEQMEGHPIAFGILDITLYRDDLTT